MNKRRVKGLETMAAVYGWPPSGDSPGDEFLAVTADHLFADIWNRPGLTVRERRLLLIGLTVGTGDVDVAGLQADAAYRLGELQADQLREIVVFLAHYAGWPRAAKLNTLVEKLLAAPERPPTGEQGT